MMGLQYHMLQVVLAGYNCQMVLMAIMVIILQIQILMEEFINTSAIDIHPATKVRKNGGKNVCPTGWHVPNYDEWTTLSTYLGGKTVAGGKLKETGTAHWQTPNSGATNETGFTALPGGSRFFMDGEDNGIGTECNWWGTALQTENSIWRISATSGSLNSDYDLSVTFGNSVRCIKD